MPGMNREELAARLLASPAGAPLVVAVTAMGDEAYRQRTAAVGQDGATSNTFSTGGTGGVWSMPCSGKRRRWEGLRHLLLFSVYNSRLNDPDKKGNNLATSTGYLMPFMPFHVLGIWLRSLLA